MMRLSYTDEIKTTYHQHMLNNILKDNGIKNNDGNFYIDTPVETFYESVMQFANCIQKICDLDWRKLETLQQTRKKSKSNST